MSWQQCSKLTHTNLWHFSAEISWFGSTDMQTDTDVSLISHNPAVSLAPMFTYGNIHIENSIQILYMHTHRHSFIFFVDRLVQLIFEEIKHSDRREKASSDSVCPREHFKDKPVDVSCSETDKTQSRAGDAEKYNRMS